MQPFLYIGIPLILLAGVWAYLFLHYRRTPVGAWKKRVLDHFGELNDRLAKAQAQIDHTERDKERACKEIRASFRDRFLKSISVAALDDYPNIGPAMVQSLHQAGFRVLSDFNRMTRFSAGKISGIGQAKWGYITRAVTQLHADCEERFRTGTFPEADAMNTKLYAVAREMEQRALAAGAEIQALRLTRDQMAMQVALANQVTFLGSVLGQNVPGLTDDFMNRPLPHLGAIVIPTLANPPMAKRAAPAQQKAPLPKADDPFAEFTPEMAPRRLPAPTITEATQTPPNDPFDEAACRTMLEIDPKWDLSVDLIRRQYHRLSAKNDPDKLKDMAEDVIAFTRQKREKIRTAAETLMAKFAAPLEPPAAAISTDPRHNPDLDAVFG